MRRGLARREEETPFRKFLTQIPPFDVDVVAAPDELPELAFAVERDREGGAQGLLELGGGREARARRLRDCARDHLIECRRYEPPRGARGGLWRGFQLFKSRRPPHEQLPEKNAERVDVAPGIGLSASANLRRRISDSSDELAGRRQRSVSAPTSDAEVN